MTLGEGRTWLLTLLGLARGLGLARIEVKVKARNPTPSYKDRPNAAASPSRSSSGTCASAAPPRGTTAPPWPPARRLRASGAWSSSPRTRHSPSSPRCSTPEGTLSSWNPEPADPWSVFSSAYSGSTGGSSRAATRSSSRVGALGTLLALRGIRPSPAKSGISLADTWRTSVAPWSGASQVSPVPIRETIALSLIDRQSGDHGLCAVRERRGEVMAVSDDVLRGAGGFLGRRGIAVEPSSIAAAAGTGCAQEGREPPTSTAGSPHSAFYVRPVDADKEQKPS
jgi:hypothetical protein